ncbi:DNA polymerase III subunit epsilon [Methylovirgula sp. 4M-Z18]|uniref:DNA polymerase III subunit epsilon n=1 Tax=Methylovirgula sp. 4M-Z18 TaxID=2293567 RepID=UPI000E2EB7F8|nr:DNA polymerase III subunit epsilon [Methylovirgula sp. 4M-Z18]RFB78110.1 DNA polymerase III subunit epsilon [Methylovirgula sp. 4M-Z18]
MREIILDTETTGLDPNKGDRLVEIGCVEIVNQIPSGQTYHVYINPERDMPMEAFNVHGLSSEFLSDKPVFTAVVDDFLAFISNARLVIHNAEFDMRFINAELKRAGRETIGMENVVDTLAIARRKHPGAPNNLDALCQRYRIDNSRRTKHGALMDAEILAEVYAELSGGRQAALGLSSNVVAMRQEAGKSRVKTRPTPLPPRVTDEELAAHRTFVATLGEQSIWAQYSKEKTDQ